MIENLISFGLTRIEATIYLTLLSHGTMTGYEIAKETGISRSNIYSSLSSLVEKGASYVMEGESSRFVPVEMKAFLKNTLKDLEKKAEYLEKHAPNKIQQETGYITIKGTRHIKNKIEEMLLSTKLRLYIMADSSLILYYAKEMEKLNQEGKKIVILTDKGILDENNFPKIHGFNTNNKNIQENNQLSDSTNSDSMIFITELEKGQLRFITDSSFVLTGELNDCNSDTINSNNSDFADSDTCLYSGQKNLVNIMKEALKNKIILLSK